MSDDPQAAPVGQPLVAYAALVGGYSVLATGALVALERSGRRVPERVSWGDLLLYGLATHKLSRIVAKDRVLSFARRPFSELQGSAGHGEVEERAVGTGFRRAVGELLICPPCISQWIAVGFVVGGVGSRRVTRLVAGVLVVRVISDFLQIAFKAAEERQDPS